MIYLEGPNYTPHALIGVFPWATVMIQIVLAGPGMACADGLLSVVILAGGKGSRLGGRDKGLLEWQGRPFIEHLLQNIAPVTQNILINANQNIEVYQQYGYPVITDETADFTGPLAGMLAALRSADTPYILTLPCDAPLTSADIVEKFCDVHEQKQRLLYIAATADGLQPVYAMIHHSLTANLQHYLAAGNRTVRDWMQANDAVVVEFDQQASAFVNINTEKDWQSIC
jgi:molybdenum cofactor guanylyltransferase